MELQLIGSAEFANGDAFDIMQSPKSPACVVINRRTGNKTRAGSPAKAWSAIRYMARVGQATEHTPGVTDAGYYALLRELSKQ